MRDRNKAKAGFHLVIETGSLNANTWHAIKVCYLDVPASIANTEALSPKVQGLMHYIPVSNAGCVS